MWYTITPVEDDTTYTIGKTTDGISTRTVKSSISGIKHFAVQVMPDIKHDGIESVVFTHLRNGAQLTLNVARADFDTVDAVQAEFNVLLNDLVKAYIVDQLTIDENFKPRILQ